jgi:hypothetical protein
MGPDAAKEQKPMLFVRLMRLSRTGKGGGDGDVNWELDIRSAISVLVCGGIGSTVILIHVLRELRSIKFWKGRACIW